MKPFEQLQRLKVAIEAGQPVPGDVGAWLLDGLEKFEMQNEEKIKPLCACLKLRPSGRRSIPYQRRLAERDAALKDALDQIPHEGTTDRQRIAELLSVIRRMQTLNRVRVKTRPQAAVCRAMDSGEPIPQTIEGLIKATSN